MKISNLFEEIFGQSAELQSQAPGRLEILGNHTDYNEGFVMSMAADFRTTITWRKTNNDDCRLFSPAINDGIRTFNLDAIATPASSGDWTNYVRGTALALQKKGYKIGGFEALVESNIPLSAGMSSSASLEMAIVEGFDKLFDLNLELKEKALIGQWCENNYIGANTGLMDQLTSLAGKENKLLISEYRNIELKHTPLPENLTFVVINSGIKHDLSCEYNDRREQCESALATLQKFYPQITALRDISLEQLMAQESALAPIDYRRALHVVGENDRVHQAQELLAEADFKTFGQLLFASHESSRSNFENSCPELDHLIEFAKESPLCYGARLSGGGFGGISIHLVERDKATEYASSICEKYFDKTGIKTTALICRSSYGAGTIK